MSAEAPEISADLAAARLVGLLDLFDQHPPGAAWLFYPAGARPATIATPPAVDHVAAVQLHIPCGTIGPAPGWLTLTPEPLAVLEFSSSPPLEGAVLESATLGWCRLVDGAGEEHLRCNVGLAGSGALVQVDKLDVYAGGLLRIVHAALY